MTKKEAIDYIENFGWSTTKLGLGRTRELLAELGNPQDKLKFIHVAGSNGKGSTCAMLDAILRAEGYKTGLYISPYIQDFCERMQVNGCNIPGDRLAEITYKVSKIADRMDDHPSQFELVTAVAMQYFYEESCDIVVLEVGLGGEMDSTNVIACPEVAVITNLGLEHTEYLGNTLHEIASAKCGIIKKGCSAVCYNNVPEVIDVFKGFCARRNAEYMITDFNSLISISSDLSGQEFEYRGRNYKVALIGEHQLNNSATVLDCIEMLRRKGWSISDNSVRLGLLNVKWPARFEILGYNPLFILDGGHNPQCAQALSDALTKLLPGKKVNFIMGVMADKDYTAIIDIIMPFAKQFYCVTPKNTRSLSADTLCRIICDKGIDAYAFDTIDAALKQAKSLTGENEIVVSFGSLYLAGEVRTKYYLY